MIFSKTLVYWYLREKRDLPWRNTKNPYYIWLSEIILQQTRVDQGMKYYFAFVEQYPTVFDLARADEQEVLNLWQGLGYYSRARNLHFSAKYIVDELNGVFPDTYSEIIKLKGVGDYTASAIASICFNEPTAVVDGNVYRALSRYFGIDIPINSTKGQKEFKRLAQELIDSKDAANHNQAIMEFGARMCKPQNPNCDVCPLNSSCFALQKNRINELPVKLKKLKIKKRYFNYLVFINLEGKTIIQKREGKGIWQNLYEFPLVESEDTIKKEALQGDATFKEYIKDFEYSLNLYNKEQIIHKLSHQHIYTKFWIVNLKDDLNLGILWNDLKDYPTPILIHNFIEEFKATEIFSIFE